MKQLLRYALFVFPFVACLPLEAAYSPAIVAADARWVVHADLNALRASALGKELITAIEKAQAGATGGVIGLDVSKVLATVGSLTAYGTNLSAKPEAVDGALILQGTADLRKIAESILLQGTLAEPKVFSEVADLGFAAYAISDPKAKPEAGVQVMVAFPPEPIVLVSKSREQLLKARDVFRGAAASLAKTPASPLNRLAAGAEGAYIFSASIVPTEPLFPQNAPQARILQLANSGAIALGERGENTFAHVELLASSDSNAEKLMKILQGMTAMLSLAETTDKQLTEFLNSTQVTREKNTVTLDLAYSSARLVTMVQALRVQAEPRPANRPPQITLGKSVAEWGGDGVAAPAGTNPNTHLEHTVENVPLTTGNLISLGRALNGGRNARFIRVEITPAAGGAPLVFGSDFMRNIRGTMWQFPFPGAEGVYHVKVVYLGDPDGKAKYAVSVQDPKAPAAAPAPAARPMIPEPKWKK